MMSAEQIPSPDFTIFSGRRVFIETYGCRYNFGSSAKLAEILKHEGCILVTKAEEADMVVLNTCTVVASTERRMLRRLASLSDNNLYVTGCMAEVQREAILAVCRPVFIPDAIIQEQYRNVGTVSSDPVAIVQIAKGCVGNCTYCITRKARGALKSVPLSEIRNQVTAYARAGAAEIQLTAQDVSAWGKDIGLTLPDVLHALTDIEGDFRIRVGMMNPATVYDILDDLIDAFSGEKLFRFIHLPVQTGSDRLLEKMQRGYGCYEFENIIRSFRRQYPDLTLSTDMIVGYPGEDGSDFSASRSLISRMKFHKVNVTRYSCRPYTAARSLPDMPESVKKERSRLLQEDAEKITAALHTQYVGRILPFIVTEKIRKGTVMARTPSYLGIVLPEDLPVGFFGKAEILEAHTYYLKGKRI